MRKLLFSLLAATPALAPLALMAQSIVTIPTQQCVWRSGDDMSWASPNLDESTWQPYSSIKLDPSEPRIWIRCHLDPAAFKNFDHPAVQVRMLSAYEVFLDGAFVALSGKLSSGHFRMDYIRVFPVPRPIIAQSRHVLALRIARRYAGMTMAGPIAPPEIGIGDEQRLLNERAGYLVTLAPSELLSDVPLIVLGIIGVVLLGFSLPDRTRPEPILLAASCILVGLLFADRLCSNMMGNEPDWLYLTLAILPSAINVITQTKFFFVLAGRRVPLLYWLLAGAWAVQAPWALAELLIPMGTALHLDAILTFVITPAALVPMAMLGTAPFAAFWPWSRIPHRMRAIAGFCMAWGATYFVFFIFVAISVAVLTMPPILGKVLGALFPGQAIAQLCVVAAVVALILRDQRQVALHRASLAGEMLAASEIQQMLAPTKVDAAPGLHIEVAFHPMREVGGDFYLCRVLPTGQQRVLLGDVSGKGAAAAMAATLLLGAAAARDSDSPCRLLMQLNRVLKENHLSGFATCLCADITPDGTATLANAGHLPPYRDGEELKIEPGLPLGVIKDSEYSEAAFQLFPGESLTFLSDGVVEARNTHGELFGFERTAEISAQRPEGIARSAQNFGQEDDITVLRLTRLALGHEPTYGQIAPAAASA